MRIPVVTTLYRAGLAWNQDNASYLGAALAYYALFSIAPLLFIGIAIVGLVFGQDAVEERMVGEIRDYVGQDTAKAIHELISKTWTPDGSFWASIVGPVVLVIAAANFFRQVRVALDMAWNLPPEASSNVFLSTLVSYLLAILMVLVTGVFWLSVMVGDATLSWFIQAVGDDLPGGPLQWHLGQFAMLQVLLTLLFGLTFRFLSHGRIKYRHLWFGAGVGAFLFLLGRLIFGLYIRYMGTQLATAFGAASSLVIFLVWVYYSAQIFLYAAEVVKITREDAGIPKGS